MHSAYRSRRLVGHVAKIQKVLPQATHVDGDILYHIQGSFVPLRANKWDLVNVNHSSISDYELIIPPVQDPPDGPGYSR